MENGIVIFGASSGGRKVAETFESFGISYCFFLDNDEKKWNTEFHGKKVCSPQILLEGGYSIVIASEHQAEIERQLAEMGQLSHLVLKEDLIIPYVDRMLQELNTETIHPSEEEEKNRQVIIDLAEGVQLGGIETWTYTVARELARLGILTEVFAKQTDVQPPEDISGCFTYYDIEYYDFRDNVFHLAEEMIKRSPCAVIVNKHTQIFYAAYLAKKIVGEKNLTVLSVIHNDSMALYRRQKRIIDMVDAVCCVSDRIRERLIQEFSVSPSKLYYKESPVYVSTKVSFQRSYAEEEDMPIRIGYAARLTKFQKRADLFPKLIEELEKRHVNYHLMIAGDGAYRDKIEAYIETCHLEDKVSILGRIPHEEVVDFWRKQDIFLSFSDFEGSSVSALEAMSQGAIPVETDVSGVQEFVENGVNGYIVPLGDIDALAASIEILEKNRDKLYGMGMKSRQIIINKCSPAEYGQYIAGLCGVRCCMD